MIESLNQLGGMWAGYFGLAVAQNTVFLVAVLLVLRWSTRLPAGVKYTIAAAGLVKLLLPPFLPAGRLLHGAVSPGEIAGMLTTLGSIGGTSPSQSPAASSALALSLPAALFVAWLLAVTIVVAMALVSTARLIRALRGSTPVTLDDLVPRPVGRDISVHRCSRIGSPLTLGMLGRRIFVPASWDTWSAECRRSVLRHEVAHIERNDSLFQSLQVLAQAVYFFHPLVWLLNRRMIELREMACDDASAGRTEGERLRYSRCLVNVAESLVRTPGVSRSATALIEGKAGLAGRVRYLVEGRSMKVLSIQGKAVLLTGAVLLLLALSWHSGGGPLAGPASADKDAERMQSIVLTIESADGILVDGAQTSLDALQADLEAAVKADGDRVVVTFAVRDEVPVSTLSACERRLRAAGLDKVVYTTASGAKLPLILPPVTHDSATLKRIQSNVATVLITSAATVMVEGQVVDAGRISDRIRQLLAANEYLIISIKTEEKATYGRFVDVLGRVKEGGATRITINDPNI